MPIFGEFSQAVTVSGVPAIVHDCSIKDSSSERVVSIDFVLEQLNVPGQAVAFQSAFIGEPVTVTQTVDGNSQTWEVVITNVTENRNGAFTYKRVQCRSLEYFASHTRFLDRWIKVSATNVVLQAWQRHTEGSPALRNISLAGVDTNLTDVEEYASKFDSLYDVMEEVCLLTGWAWKIRGNTLFFFDPLLNQGPDLNQGDRGIVRDTLRLKQSLEGIYNVFRGQAWSYSTLSIGRYFQPFDCIDGFQFNPSLLRGVEVVGEPRIVQQKWRDLGLEVANVDENGILELNKSIQANNNINGQMTVQMVVRGLHWVERFDPASIELYGRRDAPPLSDNGGDNIKAMARKLDELLRYKAYPAYDVQLEVVGVGWEPDQVVNVSLVDPDFAAPLYVTDITRTTDGNDLSVQVTLTSPSEIVDGARVPPNQPRRSRSGVDPAYEIGRRVERLERRNAHPATLLGFNTGVTGVLRGVDESSENQGWASETNVRGVSEPIGDARGWAQNTSLSFIRLVEDSQGWAGAFLAVLKPPIINEATGWQGSVSTAIAAQLTPSDARGWNQTVTTRDFGELIAEGYGWNETFTATAANDSTQAERAGWTQRTTFELVNEDNTGITLDDDVAL